MRQHGLPLPRLPGAGLPLDVARLGVDAALECARRNQLQVSIAVVDGGGHLMAFARTEGTPWHSIQLATEKARTSASFGLPSSTLGDMIDNASERIRMNLLLRPEIVAMGGAFPIQMDGRLVGALGVSGASEEEDIICALAGCEAMVSQVDAAPESEGVEP
ncbi:heme-binding protein [Pseudomonas sp. MYb185]|uniref:GlcG/HbpS family heme-binding protein n=1 Tax=Pseudomonas sp. MYb185 TaxID=1848729 RepID=UPI000CFABE3C|nr:heme-binding protein [Pseudomonas sp. MYb185]PRB81412.1 hypothetical protein CQ007_09670 [Pseudomonas sp. MYb185]